MALKETFLKKQKNLLEKERNKLEDQIKRLDRYPDYGDLNDDNIAELTDYENNMSIEDQLKYLLNKVKIAIKAIDDGSYGMCRECKEEIETGRLEAMPYAEICVKCKKNQK